MRRPEHRSRADGFYMKYSTNNIILNVSVFRRIYGIIQVRQFLRFRKIKYTCATCVSDSIAESVLWKNAAIRSEFVAAVPFD